MPIDYKSPARRTRETSDIAAQVTGRESEDCGWEESTRLIDVSPFGARFRISRPTEPGRLLHLSLPMPRRLRCYDHDEEQYLVWSLVRHCQSLPGPDDELPHFEIGVAFIGKDCPATHETDPAERYEIAPSLTENDLWRVSDAPANEQRREPRHDIVEEVVIEIYDGDGRVYESEAARTQNISLHGMAVFTSLNIARGRYVRVRSAQHRIAVIAAVRRLAPIADNTRRLHLEFVDQQWPPL